MNIRASNRRLELPSSCRAISISCEYDLNEVAELFPDKTLGENLEASDDIAEAITNHFREELDFPSLIAKLKQLSSCQSVKIDPEADSIIYK